MPFGVKIAESFGVLQFYFDVSSWFGRTGVFALQMVVGNSILGSDFHFIVIS